MKEKEMQQKYLMFSLTLGHRAPEVSGDANTSPLAVVCCALNPMRMLALYAVDSKRHSDLTHLLVNSNSKQHTHTHTHALAWFAGLLVLTVIYCYL